MALPRIFPLAPDGGGARVTPYGYLTNILRAENGDEQRIQLRRVPTFGFDFEVVAADAEAYGLQTILEASPDTAWLMPLWTWPTRLTETATTGDTHIHCAVPAGLTPLNGLFPYGPLPMYVVVRRGIEELGAAQVVNCTGGAQVNLASPYLDTCCIFAADTLVFPALSGVLSLDTGMAWAGRGVATAKLSFRAQAVGA